MLSALASLASQVLPTVNLLPHGHRKGASVDNSSATAGSAGGSNIGTLPAGASTPENLQAFMHSLFQALKQNGLGNSAGSTSAGSITAAGATGASYAGHLQSSLQTLIQQVSAGSAATSNLSAAYQSLLGNGASAAAASGSLAGASGAGLRHFLGNLLVDLQSRSSSLGAVGRSINTSA